MIIDEIKLKVDELSDDFMIKSIPSNYYVTFDKISTYETIVTHLHSKLIVIDRNVAKINNINDAPNIIKIDANEENKNIQTVLHICDLLESISFKKNDYLVVIGGGIIQDICAIAAKLFKRGIKWIYIPTTLLSICDSCIGGKAAVNNNNIKNQLALFTAPSKVIININFLKTLSDNDINCGIGEIVKLFALGGDEYINTFDVTQIHSFEYLEQISKQALFIKKAVIEHDEFEKSTRKSLNYGHTFGHAIESATNYKIPHGISIMYGMYIVNKFFNENEKLNDILKSFIDENTLKNLFTKNIDNILRLVSKDKKNLTHKLLLVRLPNCGECIHTEIDMDTSAIVKLQNIQ